MTNLSPSHGLRKHDFYLIVLLLLEKSKNGAIMGVLLENAFSRLVNAGVLTEEESQQKKIREILMNIGPHRKSAYYRLKFPIFKYEKDPSNKGRLVYHISELGKQILDENRNRLDLIELDWKAYQYEMDLIFKKEGYVSKVKGIKSGANNKNSEEVVDVEVNSNYFFSKLIRMLYKVVRSFKRLFNRRFKAVSEKVVVNKPGVYGFVFSNHKEPYVKIGMTSSFVSSRESSAKTYNYHAAQIVFFIETDEYSKCEKEIHAELKSKQVKEGGGTEFFDITPSETNEIYNKYNKKYGK